MKKTLAVLIVALAALAALLADGQVANPDTIQITYHVTNSNAFASLVRFLVDSTPYAGLPVAVQQAASADNGISAGSVVITVQDASRNKTGQEQTTCVKLTAPTSWQQGANGYSTFADEAFANKVASPDDDVVTVFDDDNNTIKITYPANKEIKRDEVPVTVCTWKLSWTDDPNAPVGDFTATIGVSYTAI